MHKMIIGSLSAVLLLTGSNVFAQFKNAVTAGANAKKLERAFLNLSALKDNVPVKSLAVSVPQGIVPANQALLSRVNVQSSKVLNGPVSVSLARYVVNMPFGQDSLPQAWLKAGGKAFYKDQSALARDLNTLYKGNTQTRVNPTGRKVKLYMLPVDGILYKPEEYTTPVILNAYRV